MVFFEKLKRDGALSDRYNRLAEEKDYKALRCNAPLILLTLMVALVFQQASHEFVTTDYGISYLDYFYFTIYFIFLLMIIVVSFQTRDEHQLSCIKYKENLISKLLFFPVFTLLIYIFTYFHFIG